VRLDGYLGLTMAAPSTYIPKPQSQKDLPFHVMLKKFALAFSGRHAPRQVTLPKSESTQDSVREIVRAHSHGNVRLQWGHFYTKKDVDARYERLRNFKFVD
jgi:hypothetical protein